MASMNLSPRNRSGGEVFFRSQVLTKSRPPPDSLFFAGQTALVTGSNVGIGLEACRQMLSRRLAHLIMAVRSIEKGEKAAADLRRSHPKANIEVWALDMGSYDSIQALAKRCGSLDSLDVAILNAGVFNPDFRRSPTGHEEGFQVNYLSTALLSALLLPILKEKRPKARPARLSIIGSSVGITNQFTSRRTDPLIPAFDDPNTFEPAMESYSDTKMCALVAAHKLAESIKPTDVIVNIVDPGLVAGSSLHRSFSGLVSVTFSTIKSAMARPIEKGAWTYIDAVAVKGPESHGGLLVDWAVHPFHPFFYTEEGKSFMDRLWEETLTELEFADVRGILESL